MHAIDTSGCCVLFWSLERRSCAPVVSFYLSTAENEIRRRGGREGLSVGAGESVFGIDSR